MYAHTALNLRSATETTSTDYARLDRALARLRPISLGELDGVALQDRTDTKLLLTLDQLASALHQLADRYGVLTIDGRRRQSDSKSGE